MNQALKTQPVASDGPAAIDQIRNFAIGTGLMSDPDFAATSDPLGAPKAGMSTDLDALAAYVGSLTSTGDSPYKASGGALTSAGETGEDVFIDYGCGMGRAVVLAATYPFRRVIGVERSIALSKIARDNIHRASHKLRCADVTIATTDARDYEVPHDATHIFLFNPFDEPIVMTVLTRIRDSIAAHPRRLSIIYALPACRRDPLVDVSWLTLKHELETIDAAWQRLAIYETC